MTASTPSSGIYTNFSGLAQLRSKAVTDTPAALQEVGRQFEAIFIQMMLQSMRQATPGDPLFGNREGDLYRDLFDKQISQSMAAKGSLGLAEIIAAQLQRNVAAGNSTNIADSGNAPVVLNREISAAGETKNQDRRAYESPDAFVQDVWPHAQQAAQQLGIDPRVLVAQAALETGWGQGMIRHADGRSANNLFGIKAGGAWQGDTANRITVEYRDGVATKERAAFRAYDSLEEGFQDYVRFLQNNPRYQDALGQVDDPQRFLSGLQAAGYATDPLYANKIQNVMDGEVLAKALTDLKIIDA